MPPLSDKSSHQKNTKIFYEEYMWIEIILSCRPFSVILVKVSEVIYAPVKRISFIAGQVTSISVFYSA
jgi:hypothetical protein